MTLLLELAATVLDCVVLARQREARRAVLGRRSGIFGVRPVWIVVCSGSADWIEMSFEIGEVRIGAKAR
jgi:hypothetical protein